MPCHEKPFSFRMAVRQPAAELSHVNQWVMGRQTLTVAAKRPDESRRLEFLHFRNRWHKMGGRLATCGRVAIGRLTFVRIFPPNTHILFVPTFRSRRLPHYHSVGQ